MSRVRMISSLLPEDQARAVEVLRTRGALDGCRDSRTPDRLLCGHPREGNVRASTNGRYGEKNETIEWCAACAEE